MFYYIVITPISTTSGLKSTVIRVNTTKSTYTFTSVKWQIEQYTAAECKVERSRPTLVLTGGYNWFKPPQAICQKVVTTGRYKSE